ncbi:MAG: ribosome silencing factor [Desulfomonile tiedjei]|nr:ribosome silencing factor [Desulfomonile tiedjei]
MRRPSLNSQSQTASKEKAETLLRAALSKKALNPVLIRLAGLTSLTDYFLIVSARSAKQVKAVAEAILTEARHRKFPRYSSEGVNQGNWALLDYGDVVVHIFQKPTREFYDLEGLWSDAPRETFPPALLAEIEAAVETDEDLEEEEF